MNVDNTDHMNLGNTDHMNVDNTDHMNVLRKGFNSIIIRLLDM